MLNFSSAENNNHHATNYAIYIYHKASESQNLPKWEKIREAKSVRRALQCAKAVHRHSLYEKIEIKKRFFCPNEQKIVSKTVRIFEKTENLWEELFKNIITRAQNV